MGNYRPTDWVAWVKRWREFWEKRQREDDKSDRGYYSIGDFASMKLARLGEIEADIRDGYDPKPGMVSYIEKTSATPARIRRHAAHRFGRG
jgi:hypothetical protein